ncbi:MAG: UpxY family transcription antiterminator [Lunatimonas sp.]|uniref:UpxY family transcription antiterminator n=1 Tax=Lunatimonas sp. TaxID=2060141 RepID=UPI00263A40F9|nr:UpxY family transcription antiterminator [Lunatimonas sp.]MCC5937207.1 UpxY family transcription antiterminator [Lunatimonas sp.]
MSEDNRWFVMYTAPRAEKKVAERLKEKGIEVYLPMVEQVRQWSDRKKKVVVPLFNGYLFVNFTKDRLWEALQVSGAVKFVNFSGEHATVPQAEIDTIRRVIETGVSVEVNTDPIEKGERVKILGGPLEGFEGECVQKSNQDYFIIRIPGINQNMLINVPRKYLDVIKD